MIKKLIAVMLVAALMLTVLPLTAMADSDSTEILSLSVYDDMQTELTT